MDARYCFRVIDVGGYGRTSDGGSLANSSFGQALRGGTLHLPPDRPLPGADHRGPQPHVFVADEAFPLRKNLMRPFPGNKSAREAIRVRESFMAHFSAEGAVSREGKPLQGRDQTQEEELIL